jgi:acetylornithine deacetylase/succinyl-diaminopimelate desuccinylase-like protein/uridine kinase
VTIDDGQPERYADLAATVLAAPPRLGPVRLVCVDGPTGAGKTVFAERLGRAVRAAGAPVQVVHTDDLLDGWADQLAFWGRLDRQVLEPLRHGRSGGYRRYDWPAGRFDGELVGVPADGVLVLDGVTSARRAARAEAVCTVFVTAPADLRLSRVLDRDGDTVRDPIRRWREIEDAFFAQDHTRSAATLVVDGAPSRPHRPDHEYVRLGSGFMTLTDAQVRAAVAAQMPGVLHDLAELVRIPGIAFEGFDHGEVERSAQAVAELLRQAGLPEVRIVRAGGQPAVIARRPAPEGAPTVLLYAHHDVQPIGDRAEWRTDPFLATERDGRLYGRGCADDKAGIMAHVAALRVFGDDLPVGVVMFIEGEEEYGSSSLEALLREHHDEVSADVIVIADSGNWAVGQPALTTSLRGLVNTFVEVRTLDHAVHSGMFGGSVPDALTTLCRLLATLHDDAGDVAIEGLVSRPTSGLDYPEERVRAEAGLLDGVSLIGTGRIVERIWTKPSVSILGIDAPRTGEAPNALVPVAKAKVSVRIAPGDDPKAAYAALRAHLDKHNAWGAQITVSLESDGAPCVIETSGPAYRAARAAFATAWDGTAPVEIGVGGSIPFIATFQELFPAAEILVTGVEDPDSRAHGPNESLQLAEFERACVAEALLLAGLAARM